VIAGEQPIAMAITGAWVELEASMMKHRQWLVTLTLCAALTAAFACGDDSTGPQLSDLVGTWTLTHFGDCEFDSGTGEWATLTVHSDGSYTLESDVGEDDEGTISVSGNSMTITSTVHEFTVTGTFTLSGDTLIITSAEDPNCPDTNTFVRS
jgi:hypothetical protein